MNGVNLIDLLDIKNERIISIVGGGGKTTTLFRLGRELKNINKKVVLTTTTKILKPDDFFLLCKDIENHKSIIDLLDFEKHNPIIIGEKLTKDNKKLEGLSINNLEALRNEEKIDYIIIEADGAKNRSIKAYDDFEPVIPYFTNLVIVVIGLDIIGKPINEDNVFRSNIFTQITSTRYNQIIDFDIIIRLINAPVGILKSIPSTAKIILLFNKLDTTNFSTEQINNFKDLIYKNSNRKISNILFTSIKILNNPNFEFLEKVL